MGKQKKEKNLKPRSKRTPRTKDLRPDLVIVDWGDAWTDGGWGNKLDKTDTEPLVVKSVGFVEATSKDGLTLIGRFTETGSPGVRSFIPKKMIRKIKKIRW